MKNKLCALILAAAASLSLTGCMSSTETSDTGTRRSSDQALVDNVKSAYSKALSEINKSSGTSGRTSSSSTQSASSTSRSAYTRGTSAASSSTYTRGTPAASSSTYTRGTPAASSSTYTRSTTYTRGSTYTRTPSSSPVYTSDLPVINLSSAEFIEYSTAKSSFEPNMTGTVYMYNFNTVMATGYVDGAEIPAEAYYGLTAYVSGRTVSLKAYDYTGKGLTVKSASVENMDKNDGRSVNISIGSGYFDINTKNFPNGLFRINAVFSNGDAAHLYFYINGADTKLCQAEKMSSFLAKKNQNRRKALNDFIAKNNITPSKYLSNSNFAYPYPDLFTWRCDNQRWIDLLSAQVGNDWSDERKVFTFVEWIRSNIAYDYYKYNVIKDPRPHYYNDFSGKYSTYDLRVGVCADFSSILTLVCRAHGIPALTIDTDIKNHAWNMVYINGRWIEIDITADIKYGVYGEDVNDRKLLKDNSLELYSINPNYDPMPSDIYVCNHFSVDQYSEYMTGA